MARVLSAKQRDELGRWGHILIEPCACDEEASLVRKALEAKALEEEEVTDDEDVAPSVAISGARIRKRIKELQEEKIIGNDERRED